MIELQNVSKAFDSIKAVDDVSFLAREGEIFGLIGPNGAGKTTTIRMIMNILAPDSGTILFGGSFLSDSDKSRIGYLPEERGLYKKVKVNDMLLFLGSLKGREREKLQQNIDSWLYQFDLMDWKLKPISELSRGMSQKIQFIAAVAHEPEILFFDEPFSGLDPVSSDLLRDAILQLSRSGKTVFFSTHIMEQAERLCNRIFLMNRGREVVYGSLDDIKASYGLNTIVVEFDGDGEFIQHLNQVSSLTEYQRWVEITLAENVTQDDLLKALVGRISIRRFELVSPSLHKIFVNLVGKEENHVG